MGITFWIYVHIELRVEPRAPNTKLLLQLADYFRRASVLRGKCDAPGNCQSQEPVLTRSMSIYILKEYHWKSHSV